MIFSRENLDGWCGRAILVLLLAMLVFAPLAFGAVDEEWFLVLQWAGAVIFLLWCARLWLRPGHKLLWPPLAWVVVVFATYAVARYFTADIEIVARAEVIQVLLFALLFLVILSNVHSRHDAQAVSFTIITLATLISGYAVFQMVTHSDRVWNVYSNYLGRAGGTYISPNHLAGLLGMVLPLALGYLLVGRMHIITRILLGYAVLTMLAGLSATFSRAGWVAAATGSLFVLVSLLFQRKHRLGAMLVLLTLLAGGGLFVTKYLSKTTAFHARVMRTQENGPGVFDVDTRFALWRAAEEMWLDHFWFGVGPAHFDFRFDEYRPVIVQERPNRAHNDYINLLADWGTAGGLVVAGGMVVFAILWLKTWPHVRRTDAEFSPGQSNRFAFFLGATGGLVSLAVHSIADFNLHIPANALVAVTLLALLAGHARYATGHYWFRIGWPARLALTVVLVATVAVFTADGWRRSRETRWLERAADEGIFSPQKVVLLQKAFACEPENFQTAYDIGESLRMRSFQGGDDYATLGRQALTWYARTVQLDPFYGYGFMRTGMCLDWLGETTHSATYYAQAEPLDPNGYFMVANIGWHYVQTEDYAMARQYFIRSMMLSSVSAMPGDYLKICEDKLVEQASGRPVFPF